VLGASLEPTDRVAMEVSGGSWEVARILEPHVHKVVVVSPDDTGIAQARTKTDKLDARALAKRLWQGELDAVWMPDKRCRVLRRWLSRREQLVRSRSRARARCTRCGCASCWASRHALTCSAQGPELAALPAAAGRRSGDGAGGDQADRVS
jgi:transposase